jgi:tetratricopeptide (TPR) repeat protein
MKIKRLFSVLFAFFLISVCIAPVFAEETGSDQGSAQWGKEGKVSPSVSEQITNSILGFAKPKWTYNGDDWAKAGDRYKSDGNDVDALHAYDKALENYGLAITEKEVEWEARDARYNKAEFQPSINLPGAKQDTTGNSKLDMTPRAKENILDILRIKKDIYKKTGENEKALDCVNTILANPPTGYGPDYDLLTEKVAILRKLGRTAEAAEVQKLADANKPEPKVDTSGSGCLIATATFGSPMAVEVQQLRDFRQNTIYSSAAGTQFMFAFETWYYSFSPNVASYINHNAWTRSPLQVLLTPLLSILSVSKYGYAAFSFNTELGVIVAGLIASSLIGLVYVFPIVLSTQVVVRRFHQSIVNATIVKSIIILAGISILFLICGFVLSTKLFHLVGSSLFVVSILLLSAFGTAWVCERWIYPCTDKNHAE